MADTGQVAFKWDPVEDRLLDAIVEMLGGAARGVSRASYARQAVREKMERDKPRLFGDKSKPPEPKLRG